MPDIKRYPPMAQGGIIACNELVERGEAVNNLYAEIEPSGGRWYRQFLPWVKRWWFEVHELEQVPTDELGIGVISHAYVKGGSGGAWTLRGCIVKARLAIEHIAESGD